ncbi:CHAD domain-containing protein [Nocardia australiensis]|uniref:CHAD domain-containing protein n=1 Tax=Nocardia australiensis TaxID=2887191 RepID=UPI001D1537F3|nr:CHAD domain-containing protein [Nocardia australiensis]
MVNAGNALVAALGDDVDRLLAAEPEVRADADDSVHQMRVATRRLRSVLRSYRGLFEKAPATVMGAELKWLAGLLGVARDAEVHADRFAALLAEHTPSSEPSKARSGSATTDSAAFEQAAATRTDIETVTAELVGAQQARYASAHAEIIAALDGHRYRTLRDELSVWRTDPPLDHAQAAKPATRTFERVIRGDRKRLRRLVFAEPTVSPAEHIELLHDIRKSAKRLRYSCAGAASTLGAAATELGANAKRLQTVLGDHRDAIESRDTIVARAAESHATGTVAAIYELLADAEEIAAGKALAHYPTAATFVSAD